MGFSLEETKTGASKALEGTEDMVVEGGDRPFGSAKSHIFWAKMSLFMVRSCG